MTILVYNKRVRFGGIVFSRIYITELGKMSFPVAVAHIHMSGESDATSGIPT